jgi:hypothetical protein
VIQQGIDEGVFHDGDPELLAATVTAVMQVQLAGRLYRAGGGTPDAEEIVRNTLVVLRRMLCVDPEPERNRRVA